MKRIIEKLVIVICLIFLVNFSMVAQEVKGENSKPYKVHFKRSGNNTTRPRCPSRQNVECYYSEGNIYIMFAISEGEAILSIKNVQNHEIASCSFDTSSSFEYYIGEDVQLGDRLEITTSNGNIYEGFFENND